MHMNEGVAHVDHFDGPTVTAATMSYKVIALSRCIALAKSLQAESRPWHSHALWPGCVENPFSDYGVVIEDPDGGTSYAAASEGFPEVDKQLVRMLHGDDILDPDRAAGASKGPAESSVLDQARTAIARGSAWHHHMCFPDCAFNREPGRWTILLETDGNASWESWDSEPTDVLWELEILCFAEQAEQ